MDPRTLATAFGAVRVVIGTSLLVAPGPAQRVWLGPGRRAPRIGVALAVRDLAVGVLTLRAVVRDEPVGPWLRVGAAVDGADAVGHLLAGALPVGRRLVLSANAGGAAALAWWAGTRAT